jgi:hypothetical protein
VARAWVLDFILPVVLAVVLIGTACTVNLLGYELLPRYRALLLVAGTVVCLFFIGRPLRIGLAIAAVLLSSQLMSNQLMATKDGRPRETRSLSHVERSFFGVIRIYHDEAAQTNTMTHGSTRHGVQSFQPALRSEPLSYYHRASPLALAIAALGDAGRLKHMAVIGLGTGTIAAYGRPGMEITFYEIDPVVVRLAKDPRWFTYLADSRAKIHVVLGDARLMIATAPPRGYDLIVLDAFSSDAIPMHLLTREALHLYLEKLADGGLIAVHISNRFLRLEPIVGRLAEETGLVCLAQYDEVSDNDSRLGKEGSHWAILARHAVDLKKLADDPRWHRPQVGPRVPLWTDDFSNILGVFNWQ